MRTTPSAFLCFFIIILLTHKIWSKKIRPGGVGGFVTEKLDECNRCKLLTDSFSHWFDKTSRGKHEGGDAAWEESKLKSYARSEMRLVEIQEGLCSEIKKNQDDCYLLYEEADQIIEKWWFEDGLNSLDLHTWLCIETLKHCCPANHYGDICTLCHLDKDNNICSGHGTCDGDGTRKGNGTCICNQGYSGKVCEKCALNYFSTEFGLCLQCHSACDGCSGKGPGYCNTCRSGWQLESDICIDIDECATPSICKTNQCCINNEGSYKCQSCDISCETCVGVGASKCTSCEQSKILWNGMCITESDQYNIVFSLCKRFCLYIGLLVISIIVYRTSKHLAAIVVLANSILMYYHESVADVHALDVFNNIYHRFAI